MMKLTPLLIFDENATIHQLLHSSLGPKPALILRDTKPMGVIPQEYWPFFRTLPMDIPLRQLPHLKPVLIDHQTPFKEMIPLLGKHSPINTAFIIRRVQEDDFGYHIILWEELIRELKENCETNQLLMNSLLSTMSEAVTIVDESGTVLVWNEVAEKVYQISKDSIIGRPIEEYFPTGSIKLMEVLSHGIPVRRTYHIPRPDRHVMINASPIKKEDKIIGAISTEQDITELVRLNEELTQTTAHLRHLQKEMNKNHPADDPFYPIKGHSFSLRTTVEKARKVAATDATVLLMGESGVGKELFAQAIHLASRRKQHSFIAINCGAIPSALFESELFGYQGGAFTGAEKGGKKGKLELADGGTLFLDEIGELPLELQAKLLRFLQNQQFYRVGGTKPIQVNIRILAATNRPLEDMVKEGLFRKDLYYRLNVFPLEIPPLRNRKEDIPDLIQKFLYELAAIYDKPVPLLTNHVIDRLVQYDWPGNIRQLRNMVERIMILCDGDVIEPHHLPMEILENESHEPLQKKFLPTLPLENTPLEEKTEQERIIEALKITYGNKKAAAKLLGISRGTLYNKMKVYGLR
ncbi:sigma 54-interacting transcriptional regulator [Microaerobacter geothermalis]|uniref:sigma-54 interaction domain-containing protein n=1 Tax=Microaerobacter geothermalis TaxID=674972 RepID=UPI001F21B991|nr:sigma 54-interacting transcriptional regulator [Microaerobacter geothermalis]MCF6095344.1 sigma 54-interacting transcriptional regulator [Microaerobacter geothermalis]